MAGVLHFRFGVAADSAGDHRPPKAKDPAGATPVHSTIETTAFGRAAVSITRALDERQETGHHAPSTQ